MSAFKVVNEPEYGPQRELPRFKCHKEVWALKIGRVELRALGLHLLHPEEEGYAPIRVTDEWRIRHVPVEGGYYVVYYDGYTSFSPAAAFESGYSRV